MKQTNKLSNGIFEGGVFLFDISISEHVGIAGLHYQIFLWLFCIHIYYSEILTF